jgi:hypothetical protein
MLSFFQDNHYKIAENMKMDEGMRGFFIFPSKIDRKMLGTKINANLLSENLSFQMFCLNFSSKIFINQNNFSQEAIIF